MKKLLSVLIISVFLLSGCGHLSNLTPIQQSSAKLSLKYTTFKFIDNDLNKAKEVERLSEWTIEQIKNNEYITLAILENQIRVNIPWDKLNYEDQMVLNELLIFTTDYINSLEIDKNTTHVYIKEAASWINEAAKEYIQTHS
ncbi:MAG: hypothetical protein ACOCV8_01380 [Spirochaetota bacterium]